MIKNINLKGGLCNRLRVVMSLFNKLKNGESLNVSWIYGPSQPTNCTFLDFFKPLENVTFTTNNLRRYYYSGDGSDLVKHGIINPGLYRSLEINDELRLQINTLKEKMGKYIAVHIRRTDHVICRRRRGESFTQNDIFIDFINKYPDHNLYIATDNDKTYQEFMNIYPDRIIINNLCKFDDKKYGKRNTEMIDAVIDMYMCIESEYFKGTDFSSFTDFILDNRYIDEV